MSFTLGIITARGGSKGIENKNIAELCGKPLIHYTIEAAQKAKGLSDIILSTDDPKIVQCADKAGLSSSSLRPAHLATDTAKSNDVLLYEIERYENETGQSIDNIMLLQPTAPLRTSDDIDAAYAIFKSSEQKTLISCYNAEAYHPQIMYKKCGETLTPFIEEGKTIIRRQEMEQVYIRNGAIYLSDVEAFKNTKNLVGETPLLYEMSREASINIDTVDDLDLAAYYLKKRQT